MNNRFNFNRYIYIKRKRDIFYAQDDLEFLRKIIMIYCKKFPEATVEDIKMGMRKFLNNCAFDLQDCSSPRVGTAKYYAYKRLTHDKKLFMQTYNKMLIDEKDETKNNKEENSYSNNPEQANEMLVKEFERIEQSFKLYTEKNKEFYLRNKEETEKYIIQSFGAIYLKYFKYKCKGKDDEALYTLLFSKDIKVPTEDYLKENLIKIIEKTYERLEQFGELGKDNENNNKLMTKLDMKGLMYPMESNNKEETIGVRDIFKKENLKELSLLQLSSLETFWINRYAKILESLSNALMIADQFNLFEKLKNGEKINLTEKELNYIFQKQNVLYGLSRDISDSMILFKKDELRKQRINQNRSVVKINAEDIFEKIYQKMGKQYKMHFSELNSNYENDLQKDFDNFYDYNCAKIINYQMKDLSMEAIIFHIVNSGRKLNWGVNEKNINNKKIILSVDVPELNMPLRLHIEKEKLIKFFNEYQGNAIIPEYDGTDDFKLEGRTLPTDILLPLGNKQKQFVKKELEEDESIKNGKIKKLPRSVNEINYLEHINYLGNIKEYPKHLGREFVKKVKGKKITGYKQKQYHYIDLETAKKYKKNEKNEYEEIKEEKIYEK